MGPNQLFDFRTAEELINKMKRQPTGWKKTIANHVTDKGSISSQINNCSQKKMRSFRSALIQRQILLRDGKLDTETHGADNTLRRQTDTEGAWLCESAAGEINQMTPLEVGEGANPRPADPGRQESRASWRSRRTRGPRHRPWGATCQGKHALNRAGCCWEF